MNTLVVAKNRIVIVKNRETGTRLPVCSIDNEYASLHADAVIGNLQKHYPPDKYTIMSYPVPEYPNSWVVDENGFEVISDLRKNHVVPLKGE
jgi:hypothetical protein